MKLPSVDLPAAVVGVCVCQAVIHPSWAPVLALGLAVVLFLGARLIAYRQAEDVAALAARLTKAEEDSKRALHLASAATQKKAPGF